MGMAELVRERFAESIAVKEEASRSLAIEIAQAVAEIVCCFRDGGKVLIAGNGGSAADAQHIAAEFVGRFKMERKALPAIALTTNTSILTAIGNDYEYDMVFSRQAEALVQPGDVFIGISTSGNAESVIRAVEAARAKGAFAIGMTGRDGGRLAQCVDIALKVPSDDTPRIQETHITIAHIICELVESEMFAHAEV